MGRDTGSSRTAHRWLPERARQLLLESLEALATEPIPHGPILAQAVAGAQLAGRELLVLLEENPPRQAGEKLNDVPSAEPLGTPRIWQAEAAVEACRRHAHVVAALTGRESRERVRELSYSPAFGAHRRAVGKSVGRPVPNLALIEVGLELPPGETLNGWLPPFDTEPWAVVLNRPLDISGRFDRTLLHELVHATQPPFLSPLCDDKELEWVLGVGNRTLAEGATEVHVQRIVGDDGLYQVEARTLTRLARRLQLSPLELARVVSQASYPLAAAAALCGIDDEQLAWEILIVKDEERAYALAQA